MGCDTGSTIPRLPGPPDPPLQSPEASGTLASTAASTGAASATPESITAGVQYMPSGNTEGSESQHCRVPVTSAEGQSPAGQVPPLVYETRPFASHEAHWDPQQAALAPFCRHVPFAHDPPLAGAYPFDSQYPASGAPLDAELDEQAAMARHPRTTEARERAALMPGPCLIPGHLSRLMRW